LGPGQPKSPWPRRVFAGLLALGLLFTGGRIWSLKNDWERFGLTATEGVVDARGFRFTNLDPTTGDPVRFDPCTDVHYVVNRDGAPYDSRADVAAAFNVTSDATGIRFVFDGYTHESFIPRRPDIQPGRYGQRWAPILVVWVRNSAGMFYEHGIGLGGGAYVANRDGRLVYVTGVIALNADEQLDAGFGVGQAWGKVILHELGHVVGLSHVENTAQVMNPNLVLTPAIWGPGDRAGLRGLGVLEGCLEVPALPFQ
jgi:hypothetical protein